MPERTDRGIRGNMRVWAIMTAVAGALLAALYLWFLRVEPEPAVRPVMHVKTPASQVRPEDASVAVSLFHPSGDALAPGQAVIKRSSGVQAQARDALSALLSDHRAGKAPVLKEVQIRAFYLDASGTAYVDLSTGRRREISSSAWEESAAVYSMVNTLTRNFEEVKRVRFLVEGKEARSLAGHLDLSASFGERMDLVRR